MRKWNTLCLLLLLLTVLTACGQAQGTEQETKENLGVAEIGTDTEAAADTVTVSTIAELIRVIAPDAHIILKPGDYNFSALTEEEIAEHGSYVDPDGLSRGEFSVYNAPGLILEAEESGTVRLITENGYTDVMTLSYCDGAVLKGLVLGHEVEKGECDSYVLELSSSQSVTVEDCGLFGCGTYGIFAVGAAGLTVTDTEIYECTGGIFSLSETTEAVFDRCRFYDNDGMFSLWEETEVLIKETEIFRNRDGLLRDYNSGFGTNTIRITFQGCTFRDNCNMGAPEGWPCATFVDCDFQFDPILVSAGTAYDDLIERYRALVVDPYGFEDIAEYGEFGVIEAARAIGDDAVYEMGYLIEDLSGDGIPELAVGELSGPINAFYTLVDGKPQFVFEGWYRNCYVYMGDGHFYYYGSSSAAETGQGVFFLTKDGTALECESFLFTGLNSDGDLDVYYNETGSWDPAESEKSDMTAEDFWALDPAGEPLPLTPFSRTGSWSTIESESPVSIQYLTEIGDEDYDWVTLYDGPDACCLLFTADSRVTDFTLLSLFAEDITETGATIFSATPVELDEESDSLPSVMTPDTPVAVQLIFPGELPAYGISYVDAAGTLRRFVIEVSGYDGSLLLREADPDESGFVLYAGW